MSLMDDFSATQYAPYIQSINPNNILISVHNECGNGRVYVHNVFQGILALCIDISSKEWPSAGVEHQTDMIFFNYCIKGRCEVSLSDGLTTCVSEGELIISKNAVIKEYFYPLKQYEGIEIIFNMDALKHADHMLKEHFDIDITQIFAHYTTTNLPFTTAVNAKVHQLLKEMCDLNAGDHLLQMRIHMLHLLHLLSKKEIISDQKKRTYLTSSQIQIAKSVEAIITKDLQKKITVTELSDTFNVSATTLKTYFKGLYGKNISTYLQELRMNKAAKLIAETKHPISDISSMVGYENQSKFAAVFKNHFAVSPLEYRRVKHYSETVTHR